MAARHTPNGPTPGGVGHKRGPKDATPSLSRSPLVRALFDELNAQRISMRDMAGRIKSNPVSIHRFKTGGSVPNTVVAERLASALGGRIVFVKGEDQ